MNYLEVIHDVTSKQSTIIIILMNTNEYFKFWQRLLKQSEIKNVFSPIIGEINKIDTLNIFKNVFKNDNNDLGRPQDLINHSLYFEAKTFLHGLFIVEDKLSMAHSMETRVPFMDNDLVDFAMRCPVSLKLNNLRDIIDINENEHLIKKKNILKKLMMVKNPKRCNEKFYS